MRNLIVLFCLVFVPTCFVWSQRNPNREILVFFETGVEQMIIRENGNTVSVPTIKGSELRSKLSAMGISVNSIEIANPRFKESDTLKILQNGRKISQLNLTKLFRIKVGNSEKRKQIIENLRKLPEVLYAEANGTVTPYLIPSDEFFEDQWGLLNTLNPGADIHADPAWDIFTGDPDNIIAIIDGGIDANHEDLDDKVTGGDNGFGWGGHGIHVAGIAAAISDNDQGVSGVDWNAQIHAQRIDNVEDDVDTYNAIIDAVDFSTDVQVLNHSWGLLNEDGTPGRYSTTVRQAFAYAYKAGRTSVVAMGNHQQTDPNVVAFPAGFNNVIAVGASNINDEIAGFSAHGIHIDVSAPGVNILSTFTGGGYGNNSGTSMATPHVSGLASLLNGFNANLSSDDIENLIRLSADDLNNPGAGDGTAAGFDNSSGAGRINMENALNLIQSPNSIVQATEQGGTTHSVSSNLLYQFLGAGSLASGNYIVKRHEVRRTVTFAQPFCELIGVWGRGAETTGWNLINPNFGEGFAEVVPGTSSVNGVILRTYVYEVTSTGAGFVGWFPTNPTNVTFAYTALGIIDPNPNKSVNGPSIVCTTNSTFTLNNINQGNPTWSVSPSNLFANTGGAAISGIGANAIVRAASSSASGQASISYLLTGIDCSDPIVEDFWVGPFDSSQIMVSGTPGVCSGNQYTYTATLPIPHDPNFNYTWSFPQGWQVQAQYDNHIRLYVPQYNTQYGIVSVNVNNGCGPSGSSGITVFPGYSCGYNYSIYPNPAGEELNVEIKTQDHLTPGDQEFEVNLISTSKNLLRTGRSLNGKLILDIRSIPKGIYFLQIIKSGEIITEQIIVD